MSIVLVTGFVKPIIVVFLHVCAFIIWLTSFYEAIYLVLSPANRDEVLAWQCPTTIFIYVSRAPSRLQ